MQSFSAKWLLNVGHLISALTFSQLTQAAPLYIDFEQPMDEIRNLTQSNGITLAPYISNSCGQCNGTNHVLAGGNVGNEETFLQFMNISSVAKVKKVTMTIGEWYAPETWAQEQAGNLRIRYTTTTGFTNEAVYPYPLTPVIITIDAANNGFLSYIGTRMENKPYVPWMDNITFYREGDEEKVKLSIAQMRLGQRVFEPSATNGASTDLVTKKPYAVEVTLSANVPTQHKDLLARADLFVNGVFYQASAEFKIGDIISGQSKAFIFWEEQQPGTKSLEVRIVPVNPSTGIFEITDAPTKTRTVNFHEAKLSLLVSEITGCADGILNCFSTPTAAQRETFDTAQVPFAETVLPLSYGGLEVANGRNLNSSVPGTGNYGETMYRDSMDLWLQKKIALKDLGVFFISDDYFLRHGLDFPSDIPTLGFVIKKQPGVLFVNSRRPITLAHELIHSLAPSEPHSSILNVEGLGDDKSEIWTLGHSLDSTIQLKTHNEQLLFDLFGTSFPPGSNEFGIGRFPYNSSLKTIISGKIDPKVVLVTGVIKNTGESVYFDARKADAFLDPAPLNSDLTVQGLNSQGIMVSSVPSIYNDQIEVIKESGPHSTVTTESGFYFATLPDDGTITQIRVIKNSKILFTRALEQLTLEKIIYGLNVEAFKQKAPVAKAALLVVNIEWAKYIKSKNKPKVAKVSLILLKETILRTLKDNIVLKDGTNVSKKRIVELIDAEIKSLK